jgi:hypothetical protein
MRAVAIQSAWAGSVGVRGRLSRRPVSKSPSRTPETRLRPLRPSPVRAIHMVAEDFKVTLIIHPASAPPRPVLSPRLS